jgi:hypothetical protein
MVACSVLRKQECNDEILCNWQKGKRCKTILKASPKLSKQRHCPSSPAKEHKGKLMEGDDGRKYKSVVNKNGVYRWQVVKSVKSPVVKSAKSPVVKSAKSPVVKSVKSPVVKSAKSPVVKSVKSPVVKSAKSPVVKSVKSPVVKSAKSPVVKSVKSPVVKSAKSPVVKSAKSPVVKSVKSPVVKLAKLHVLHCQILMGAIEACCREQDKGVVVGLENFIHESEYMADCNDGEALLCAALNYNSGIVNTLLSAPKHAADVNSQDGSALILALDNEPCEDVSKTVLTLLKHKARVDCMNGLAILIACRRGHDGLLKKLLAEKTAPKIDKRMMFAAATKPKIIEILLKRKPKKSDVGVVATHSDVKNVEVIALLQKYIGVYKRKELKSRQVIIYMPVIMNDCMSPDAMDYPPELIPPELRKWLTIAIDNNHFNIVEGLFEEPILEDYLESDNEWNSHYDSYDSARALEYADMELENEYIKFTFDWNLKRPFTPMDLANYCGAMAPLLGDGWGESIEQYQFGQYINRDGEIMGFWPNPRDGYPHDELGGDGRYSFCLSNKFCYFEYK